jgi:osmoprotectant transport system permease protein
VSTTATDELDPTGPPGEERDDAQSLERERVSRRRLTVQPVAVLAAVAAVVVYVQSASLTASERGLLTPRSLIALTWEHVQLTAVTGVIVVLVAVPAGILLTRRRARRASPPVVAFANFGQAAPLVGLLVLAAALLDVGFWTAVLALSVYGILPILRNTITGLGQVDRSLVEAARGMGMSARGVLMRVELPLAVPVILTGIRLSLTLVVGGAALAVFIGGGGLGQLITTGVNLQFKSQLVVGAVLIASLALLVDWLGRVVEEVARPKGLS